ncbi:hypothetical protein [Gordonia oryzae]|uniref:hypothetical protein n=1 Tax=Gordonia oryzae TaxID=2487349 RepID=UPI000F4DBB9F|nr:hypothetical protein [Gordonia oryzae]
MLFDEFLRRFGLFSITELPMPIRIRIAYFTNSNLWAEILRPPGWIQDKTEQLMPPRRRD